MKQKSKKISTKKKPTSPGFSGATNASISIDQMVLVLLIVVFYATAIVFGTIKLPSIVDVIVLIILLTMLLIPTIWIALNLKQPPSSPHKHLVPPEIKETELPEDEFFMQYDLASMKAHSDMIN